MPNKYTQAAERFLMEKESRGIFDDAKSPTPATPEQVQDQADLKKAEDTQREDYIFGKDRNKGHADKFGSVKYTKKDK